MRIWCDRGNLRGQVSPCRVTDQDKPGQVGSNMLHSGFQHAKGIAYRRHGVRQKLAWKSADIVLITRKNYDVPAANQVVYPCTIEGRVDRKPAVEKNNH